MKRFVLLMILLLTFLVPAKVFAEYDATYDWDNDQTYQSLAEDFRKYSVCQAIYRNLSVFVAIHYGIGDNLGYPQEWLEQQKLLLQNANSQEVVFGEKTERTIQQLMLTYNLPYQMLDAQRTKNQAGTTQSIMFSLAPGSQDPNLSSVVIKGILTESSNCQVYQEKGTYE